MATTHFSNCCKGSVDSLLRGILLFGVASGTAFDAALGVAVETMVQSVWHLGKPLGEAWGAPVWGIVAGCVALRAKSVWPLVMVHWVLNVLIDAVSAYAP